MKTRIPVLLLLLPFTAKAEEAISKIGLEIERLDQAAAQAASDPKLKDFGEQARKSLGEARQALQTGRAHLSLEKLGQGQHPIRAAQIARARMADATDQTSQFQSTWEKQSLDLTARDQKAREWSWEAAPALVRAAAEAAQARTMVMLEASRAYAAATEPKYGFFYLGDAEAFSEFAEFCHSLTFSERKAALPLRSVLPEIQRLQDRTNAAFQPPRSIELHSKFILLNSTLKFAGELDAAKLYAGALYKYLDAVQQFGMLAPGSSKNVKVDLRRALARVRTRIESTKRDESIGALFLERAEALTEAGSDNSREAQVLVDQVMPSYFSATKPSALKAGSKVASTTVTLVRWPYT